MRNLFSLEKLIICFSLRHIFFSHCRVQPEWCLSQILTWIKGKWLFLLKNVDPLAWDRLKFCPSKYEMRLWYMQRHVKLSLSICTKFISSPSRSNWYAVLVKLLREKFYQRTSEKSFSMISYSLTRLTSSPLSKECRISSPTLMNCKRAAIC